MPDALPRLWGAECRECGDHLLPEASEERVLVWQKSHYMDTGHSRFYTLETFKHESTYHAAGNNFTA